MIKLTSRRFGSQLMLNPFKFLSAGSCCASPGAEWWLRQSGSVFVFYNMMPTHYTILGISSDASEKDVKKAYKVLAKKWHPDRNPDNLEVANKMFKEVSEAYKVLGDSVKRRQYDRGGDMNSARYSSIRNRQHCGTG